LKETVSDNPKQVKRLEEIEVLIREWQNKVMGEAIGLRREIGNAETMNDMAGIVEKGEGKKYFDRFRDILATFADTEENLITERKKEAGKAYEEAKNSIQAITETDDWTDHAFEVLANAGNMLTYAAYMESSIRGFLITGDEEFIETYQSEKDNFFNYLKVLKQLAEDSPSQVKTLEEAGKIIENWIEEVEKPSLAMRKEMDKGSLSLNNADEFISQKTGKKIFDAFRKKMDDFANAEKKLMTERKDKSQKIRELNSSHIELLGKANVWVDHSHKVIQDALKIMVSAIDTETGMRGYLLTGKEEFLEPYNDGRKNFYQLMTELKKTVNDNPEQVALLDRLEETFSEWIKNVTEPDIKLRRKIAQAKTMDNMADLMQAEKGKIYFDRFRSMIKEFTGEEEKLMEIRRRANADMTGKMKSLIVAGGIFVVLIALAISWLLAVSIVRPISNVAERLKDIAEGEGDLTMRLQVESQDEIGELAMRFNRFVEKLQGIIRQVSENTETLGKSSGEMADVSQKMTKSAEEMTNRAADVSAGTEQMSVNISNMASATEEMSANAQNVSATSEQMSHNMDSVASAVEEMSVSIRDIAGSAGKGARISEKAREMADSATAAMSTLGEAAGEIGEVTEVIRRIAEQTNLLALNATIEAASAGDAGRGFAVVANEIKELAGQSAKAAENIARQIGDVQKNTEGSVEMMGRVSAVIAKLNDAVLAITASVEQLARASEDISANVSQASAGVNNIAESISEVAKGSNDMAMNAGEAAKGANNVAVSIRSVSNAANDTDALARKVSTSAKELSRMASELGRLMGQFRIA